MMRRTWSANSVSVSTARSGAANVVLDDTDPDNKPISYPTASATRADSASYTVAGDKHRVPASIARNLLRCSVWFMIFPQVRCIDSTIASLSSGRRIEGAQAEPMQSYRFAFRVLS
jgi:hypothetical protein